MDYWYLDAADNLRKEEAKDVIITLFLLAGIILLLKEGRT